MIAKTMGLISLCFALALLFGCGKTEEEKEKEKAMEEAKQFAKRLREVGKETAEVQKQPGGGRKIKAVDFRDLKALLPESLAGMKRTDVSGERTAAMGMEMSHAEATYEPEGAGSVRITITDLAGMVGTPMMMGMHAWARVDIDRETQSGYEKTTKFSGYRAHENYDNSNKRGSVQVLVGDRFMVEAEGSDVKMDAIKAALGKFDLGKLEKMKNQGVGK